MAGRAGFIEHLLALFAMRGSREKLSGNTYARGAALHQRAGAVSRRKAALDGEITIV
jgi:hypothetical protein